MSTSTIIELADAVVVELNGAAAGTFSQSFTAKRYYVPVFDLKEMRDLHVSVVPVGVETTTASRALLQHDVQLDVAVQQKFPQDTAVELEAIDDLMGLVQEISDFLRAVGRFGDALWIKTENKPVYSPEHMGQLRQFTSVLTLTLRILRA